MPAHHGHGSSAGRSSRPGGGSYRLPPREPETGRRPGMVQHARSKERACATPCGSRGDTPSHSVSYCVSLYHVHVLRAFALSQAVSQLRLREPSVVRQTSFQLDLLHNRPIRLQAGSSRRHGWRERNRRLSPRCPALLPGHEKGPRIFPGAAIAGGRAVQGIAAPIAEILGRPSFERSCHPRRGPNGRVGAQALRCPLYHQGSIRFMLTKYIQSIFDI